MGSTTQRQKSTLPIFDTFSLTFPMRNH
jgi:hypothetical protein